jgi:hypothetical protein
MTTEIITQWMGGLLALTTLGILFCGIWRGFQRQAGRTTGLILVSFGALLIYSTWTTLIYAFFAPLPLCAPAARKRHSRRSLVNNGKSIANESQRFFHV